MHLVLSPTDPRTLPVQICAGIREQIQRQILSPGQELPSTRALAAQLGISRGSVVTAYDQLLAEGYLEAAIGSGTRVCAQLLHTTVSPEPASSPPPTPGPALELTPGLADTARIVTPEWRAAWREAATGLGPSPAQGHERLREEVAAHLGHMRGLSVSPDRIVITAGARDGLTTLIRAAFAPGSRFGVESPGYPSLRRIPSALGHRVVDVPADKHGVTVPADVDALIVTPSHQYPFGGSLPAPRRTALAAWARESTGLLIEDDFDSELRYAGAPLPALAALEPDNTVLLGTFSSVISPSIGCGYVVLPPRLVEPVLQDRELFGQPVSAITQKALANFLASGALRRHTGRMRRAYKRRRDLVYAAFASLPGTQLLPIHGGLHAVVLCDRPADEVIPQARARGVGVTALAHYWGGHQGEAANGLVLGFGHVTDQELVKALEVVVSCL
ncbi:GntR family transcriptional regulator [Corynebacterium phocae]|uniref:GntR family transcriptional regulator n=1 Tax=Corynebacterium phocae TaxID=161895 RepID=A0A1L7D518_9CORY|nr:PLP-dependent aminotransferase family protein [Corynebacterium phocae]APT93157.1 GntR family transcriptional regulator [Corynebacterium phocae]KAA8722237.1 PLP-dependent aminotransferase family protein [Corynebacterium phocae]